MVRTPDEDLKRELQDQEYVKLYGASDAKAETAITLCEARQTAGKTQKDIAEAMGLSQPYIAKLEGGEANPTIGTIGSILATLGCRLVANTAPLLPEPTPVIFNLESAAGISTNDLVGVRAIQKEPSIDRWVANDYHYYNAAATVIGWPPSEIEEHRGKITVGGTV